MNKGAPTKYRKEYDLQAYKLALLGATDKDLADFFEVTEQSVNNWKKDHPEFFESVKKGKVQADAAVAEKLWQRATGYTAKEIQTIKSPDGVTTKQITREVVPDTTAIIFWLKNRKPEVWRDKQEIEHTNLPPLRIELQNIEDAKLLDEID